MVNPSQLEKYITASGINVRGPDLTRGLTRGEAEAEIETWYVTQRELIEETRYGRKVKEAFHQRIEARKQQMETYVEADYQHEVID